MNSNLNLLFIGNSFVARNDLPGLLTELAASALQPRTIVTDTVLVNGASLRQHWNAGKALEKIRGGKWDYVVLQEQSTLPIKNATRFHENVRLFAPEIVASDALVLLYLTWARLHAPETQAALTGTTLAIAEEFNARVAPAGVVWEKLLQAHSDLPLHDKDGSHPSPLGTYLAACVFYATLFQESPVGLAVPARLKLTPENAAIVQKSAEQEIK